MELALWKQLPDKIKSMVMEIRKEGIQKAELSSPFTGKPNSTTTRAPAKLEQSDSILKPPKLQSK